MRTSSILVVMCALSLSFCATQITAQASPAAAASAAATLPPATKIEAFKPAAGSVVTLGYDELGATGGVTVDVRELRDASSKGATARGLLVEVIEGQYRKERSFVDADEIPELLRGIDALLDVKSNPTSFKNFEVRYTTRGELRLTAFNSSNEIKYAVDAGRLVKASRIIDADDMRKLRDMFAAAQSKLTSIAK